MFWFLFSGAVGIFIGYLFKKYIVYLEVQSLKEQLQSIQTNNLTHTELSLKMESSEFVSLINELNDLLRDQRYIVEQQQAKEKELLDDIANISHDLRTPLTALYGYLELLNQAELTEKDKNNYLSIALSRTEVLQNLIHNLFYLTRLQVKNISLETEQLSIQQLIKEQVVLYYQSFKKQQIELDLDIKETRKTVTNLDAAERIVNNLLMNMIEHGELYGKISISEENNRIITRFENQIDPKTELDLSRIFDRHYMANTHRNSQNSGLGLTIIKELIDQLGHDIEINLEENKIIVKISW